MRFDPEKLARQRHNLGLSQETLATLAKVSVRTVQRAENGDPVRRENMADMAAALRLPLHALVAQAEEEPESAGAGAGAGGGETVTLRRMGSGREILDLVEGSGLAKLECEVDPTPERLPVLKQAIALIEPLLPDPWVERRGFASLAERLETIAGLDGAMAKLSEEGLAIFAGRRFEQAVMPVAHEEGRATRRNQQAEPVAAARLLIADADADADKKLVEARVAWPVKVVRDGVLEQGRAAGDPWP